MLSILLFVLACQLLLLILECTNLMVALKEKSADVFRSYLLDV